MINQIAYVQEVHDKVFRAKRNMPLPYSVRCKPDKDHFEWYKTAHEKVWWEHDNLLGDRASSIAGGQMSEAELDKFRRLHILLLSIGGRETVLPVIEEDMRTIMERGRFYKGTSKMMPGRPSRCHSNAANLWEQNRDKDVHIATGYALSDDGFWRQHSWLVHRYVTPGGQHRTRIVETTAKRLCYFGFEMTDEEAEEFADKN